MATVANYQEFEAKYIGQAIETDGVPKGNPFQCVDEIKQWLKDRFDVPFGSFGNAMDYWFRTHPAITAKLDKLEFEGSVRAGDILPLKPATAAARHAKGHIGIATGVVQGDQVEILEQNGSTGNGLGQGKDKVRKRFVPMSRVLGILRGKVVSEPSPHANTYTVHKEIAGYRTAADAAKRQNSNSRVPTGAYSIFNLAADMVNVTRKVGTAGWWINPADNVRSEPVPTPPAPPAPRKYTVMKGDNLSKIAAMYGLPSWKPLYERNRDVVGPDPNKIRPGQVLIIP